MQRITDRQNNVVITDRMWARLLSSTNQPSFLSAKDVIEDKKEDRQLAQKLDGEVFALITMKNDNSSVPLRSTDSNV